MVGMNNKKDSKDDPSFFQRIHKLASSATVFALLLPSISSIGLVQAAETELEDPPVEDVAPQSDPEIDPTDDELEAEVEDTNIDAEAPLPDTVPEEGKTDTPPSPEKTTIETEQQVETSEDTTEEVHNDAIVPEQLDPEQDLPDPTEVRVLIHVRTPNNMENYGKTLEDFANYPLILTNQVTDETFTTSIRPGDNNTSNYFTLEATVHAYVRGNAPENDYDITLPQGLIDLGYSLTRDHRVRSNFGIVGSTNLSYNAPQVDEVIGTLRKNTVGYSYLVGRDLQILLESLDGTRSYSLGNRDISIPAGEYNLSIGNAPSDSRPNVIYRRGTLVNVPETEIPVTKSEDEYIGRITLDFTSSSQTHVLRIIETDLEVSHTVTIDPNGGTIDPEYEVTVVEDGEIYDLPYTFQSGLSKPGYTLIGYTVNGTLLDSNGNAVTELTRYTGTYIPESDVTLTAIWEVSAGGFRAQIYDDSPATQTERYTVTLIAEDGTEYPLTSNQYGAGYRLWRIEDVPNGVYTLSINGYNISSGEKNGQPDTTSSFTVNNDGTATVDLEFVDNKSTTFIRYSIYGESIPEPATYPLGIEVRDLDNKRTDDVDITVANEGEEIFAGSYNDYLQWFTDEELLEGLYTITLDTPNGTYAEINDTVASQHAEPTDEKNVFTIMLNDENLGSLSAIFAAFKLVEEETNTVTINPNGGTINEEYITAEVFEGDTYSLPSLFRSGLSLSGYTLAGFEVEGTLLDSEGNAVTEIPTYTTRKYTPESDVTLTAIWEETTGEFIAQIYDDAPGSQRERYTVSLVAEDGTEYPLTSNQYGPGHRTWKVQDVPNDTYTLVINGFNISDGEKFGQPGTTSDFVVNDDGTATVELEFADNNSTTFIRYRIYGEPIPEPATYPLGVEVRDLDNKRTDDVDIVVTNEDEEVFTGSYNDYLQWFTDEELPEGLYTITLTTPEGTVAEINDTVASQRAVATDEENVFTIEVNEENQGSLSAVFAAFRLVEVPPVEVTTYQLGVEVRDLDDKRTDEVDVVVTNQEGEIFSGEYNEYLQWLTDEELPEGLYTITLTTPEGTIAEINDTTDQYAVATDEENVFTILLNDENLGYGSSIYGAFRLVKVDDDTEEPEEPTDPEEPTEPEKPEEPTDPTDPSEPEKPEDSETPGDKEEDDSEKLPQTGMTIPSIGLGIASILGGLGLLTISKKRKEEDN